MGGLPRRTLLLAGASLAGIGTARAEPGFREAWLGTWRGAIAFRRSLPLEDIYPPPKQPHIDFDDKKPIPFQMTLALEDGRPLVRTRIDGGPMQTAPSGETLRFAILSDGVASLVAGPPRGAPHAALLTVRPDAVGTEALFRHAEGSFWRRHITLRFAGDGADVILWIFDAEGTRARTWRGDAVKDR